MGVFITISKLLKQMCVLYIELFIEIGKMIKENTRKIIKCVFIGIGVFALCVALATAVFYSMGAYNKYIFTQFCSKVKYKKNKAPSFGVLCFRGRKGINEKVYRFSLTDD